MDSINSKNKTISNTIINSKKNIKTIQDMFNDISHNEYLMTPLEKIKKN